MKLSASLRLRVEKDVITRLQRSLRGEGKVYVSEGREVSPGDIIGSATILAGYRTVNLASLLWVKPADVTKYIQRQVGQKIYKGELLAHKKGGLFSREKVITSPCDGILDFVNNLTGEVRLSLPSKKLDLAAGVYGMVEKVDTKMGSVLIRTQVTKIYGIFGTGKIREGTLSVLTDRYGVISPSQISPKFDERILAGGSLSSKDTLRSAISQGVSGVIVGGINATDYKAVGGGKLLIQPKLEYDTGLSLVVCEGFGAIGLGEDIYESLKEYDGRFVSIDGNAACISLPSYSSSSMIRVRKTSLLDQQGDSSSESKDKVSDIYEGVRVRIVGSSFTGEQGKVIALDKTETLMSSQIRSFMVTVETKRRKIQVPYTNVEII